MEEDKKMEEIKDLIDFLGYKFEEQDIPYILGYRPNEEEWSIQANADSIERAVGISKVISDMSDETDIETDDLIAAISELTEMNKEKKRKKTIKEIQKKICPLCSLNYGDDEDYCGYGDTCELIKRIREGKQA